MDTIAGMRTTTESIPDGLPVLSRGGHTDPAQGACFMEYASLLAGEKFTDCPRCTHPLLAHTARMVNDVLDDDNRQRIAPLISAVIGVKEPAAPITAELVTVLTDVALRADPELRRLARFQRRAERRQRAVGFRRWLVACSDPMYRTGAGAQAITLSVHTVAGCGPTALREALEAAIAAARGVAGFPGRELSAEKTACDVVTQL
jgi:hypothetical protein